MGLCSKNCFSNTFVNSDKYFLKGLLPAFAYKNVTYKNVLLISTFLNTVLYPLSADP